MMPEGVMLGLMGSVMAIMYKVNGIDWKGAFVILISGSMLSGYSMPVLSENLSLGKGTSFFIVFLIGFLAPEVFAQLKRFAPGALKLLGTRVKKIIHKDSSTNDK
jgi:hypothetical protein